MIPRLDWWRVALASTSLILGLAVMGQARAATVLTAASVQKLVVAEDSANFLAQVALMAGQVPQIKGLTSDKKSGLIQGSWCDVQTAAPALANVLVVAGAAGTNAAVAQRLKKAVNALTADITNLGNAVTANPLSTATQAALQTMGKDAQVLVKEIQRDYALLPATQRPVELTLATAAGQTRVFSANTTVKFVLSGPKAAITGGNGTWALSSGRQNAAQPPLSTPFSKGALTGTSASARQAMQATATTWGAWTYVYYQYGLRRPELLLLNLGSLAVGGNTTGGGSLATGAITTNAGGSLVVNSSGSTVTLTGNINNGSGSLTKAGTGTLVLSGTDTYTGGTTINGGTLQFATLGDLGDGGTGGSSTTSNLVINGGTLQYVGSGTTTDRLITLGSNGATIAASGTGPITFNNTGNLSFNGSSATTLTLAGDNTGNNTLSAAIGDQTGGSVSVTKTGSGTWVLTGNNTYTGNTTVNAGTLVITNLWFASGNIFVLGAGTFAYQPDGTDSLTVSAAPVDGSAYPWGNTTYEVDVQADGSWVLPALNAQIVTVTGGYEIVAWTGAGSGELGGGLSGSIGGSTDNGGATTTILNGEGSTIWLIPESPTYTGNATINAGTLVDSNASLAPGNIVVRGTGTLQFQPDGNDSLTVSAVPVAESTYAWGDTTYEVDVQTDGSWVLPTLGIQIVAITGGYEIVPWTGAGDISSMGLIESIAPEEGTFAFTSSDTTLGNRTIDAGLIAGLLTYGNGTVAIGDRRAPTVTITANATWYLDSPYNSTIFVPVLGEGSVSVSGGGVFTLTGNASYSGTTTISGGALVLSYPNLPSGNIVVQGSGEFAYQPTTGGSLTVSAVPVAGNAYVWGNTTYEVDVQTDGSWVLPALGVQILAITGGFEIVPWVVPAS